MILFGPLIHSAKGSEWGEHKYIKKIDGNYYYPDSYKGGRHLDDSNKEDRTPMEMNSDLDEDMINQMASDAIRGLFGNGQDRKDLLGENYQRIQDRVNEILKTKVSSVSESDKKEAKDNLEAEAAKVENKTISTKKAPNRGKVTKTAGQKILEKSKK